MISAVRLRRMSRPSTFGPYGPSIFGIFFDFVGPLGAQINGGPRGAPWGLDKWGTPWGPDKFPPASGPMGR